MDRIELESLALDIMGRADMVTLATMGKEPYPHVRALFNLRDAKRSPSLASYQADKGLSVYLGTTPTIRCSVSIRSAREAGVRCPLSTWKSKRLP